MLQIPLSPVPSISISFAPHELPPLEPKSPFTVLPEEPDSPRPTHLLPPLLTPRRERQGQLSPLGSSSANGNKGLERQRFEAMLKASKERSAMVGAKKPLELRKEIAMKAQKAKQCERRARFLSKLVAPPSPSAADMPVTPPDSPAVFHFSLPSPGLVSPLELFEDVTVHPELYNFKTTIEQVDFRLPQQKQAAEAARQRREVIAEAVSTKQMPSLDQISQRLSRSSAPITTTRSPSPEQGNATSNRLPSFLRARAPSPTPPVTELAPNIVRVQKDEAPERPCLHLPTLALTALSRPIDTAVRAPTPIAAGYPGLPAFPLSPKSPCTTKLQITTTICPPTRSKSSPTEFTEANITEFGTTNAAIPQRTIVPSVAEKSRTSTRRVQASRDLFSKLSRRTNVLPGAAACGVRAQDDTSPVLSPSSTLEDKLKRRLTAPAEMSSTQRGACHPVLTRPGGF